MFKRAEKIGNIIKKSKKIHIVSHIDADGLTAGSIAYLTLKRLGKDYSIEFVKQLDDEVINRLRAQISLKEKLHYVDKIIENNHGIDEFRKKITAVYREFQNKK